MKVGIVTLLGNNYGGTLQGYALKRELEKMGIEVIQIKYKLMEHKRKNIKEILKRIIYLNRHMKFKRFKKTYFNLTPEIKNINKLNEDLLDCDAYIAGSDQIWNPQISLADRKIFYLDFVKKAKKIAYAASIGKDMVKEEEKTQISYWLNNLDYISIREKTGVDLYSKLTNKKIENVLDPTLLLSNNEWDEIIDNKKIINDEYIFSYTLGANRNVLNTIEKISKQLNIKIVEISYKRNFKNEIKNINNAGPIEFLNLVKNAKYILTNSFHGMVFAILNKKDFFVFTRENMNSRIYDLLSILNLKNRIINNENMDSINVNEKINYDEVYDIVNIEREKSLKFLKEALGVENKK